MNAADCHLAEAIHLLRSTSSALSGTVGHLFGVGLEHLANHLGYQVQRLEDALEHLQKMAKAATQHQLEEARKSQEQVLQLIGQVGDAGEALKSAESRYLLARGWAREVETDRWRDPLDRRYLRSRRLALETQKGRDTEGAKQ